MNSLRSVTNERFHLPVPCPCSFEATSFGGALCSTFCSALLNRRPHRTPLHRSLLECISRTHALSSAAGRTWQVGHTRTNFGAIRDCQPAVGVVEE